MQRVKVRSLSLSSDEFQKATNPHQPKRRDIPVVTDFVRRNKKSSKKSKKCGLSTLSHVDVKGMNANVVMTNDGMIRAHGLTKSDSCHYYGDLRLKDNGDLSIETSKLVLRRILTRGPYGIVYSAVYKSTDVSVKLLDWGEEDSMSRAHLIVLRKSFISDVEMRKDISHPNLSKFLGAALANDGFMIPSFRKGNNGELRVGGNVCCFMLEELPGGSIREFLINHHPKKLQLKSALKIALDFARGLAYLHSKGVLLRAVKTDNVFFDKKGVAKILDFSAFNITNEQKSGDFSGAISPEVDRSRYAEKAEVHAFGFCLWEILNCDVSRTDKQISDAMKSGTYPMPTSLPYKVARVFYRCWEENFHKRANMKEVVMLLEEAQADLSSTTNRFKRCLRQCLAF